MAKYTVNYKCGHKGTVQLYGHHYRRDIEIERMERRQCPQCWRKTKLAENDMEQITAAVGFAVKVSSDGQPIFEIILSGGTRRRKEEIKALGYHWSDVRGGVLGLISALRAQKKWIKYVSRNLLALELSEISKIAVKIEHRISDADWAVMEKLIADQEEEISNA